mgnify:CR=1 FL=1
MEVGPEPSLEGEDDLTSSPHSAAATSAAWCGRCRRGDGMEVGELMLLRSGARRERTKEDGAPPAAPILDSAALSLRGNAVIRGFARQGPPVRRSGRLQPGKRRRRPILFRERETWVGRGHKSSPASTGGRCSTGSSVAGVGRLLAAEIGRRGRARAFLC